MRRRPTRSSTQRAATALANCPASARSAPRIKAARKDLLQSWQTYVRVAGSWVYLFRAVDSTGDTIDLMLSPNRDLVAAKQFLQLALHRTGRLRPGVINVDGHPAYAIARRHALRPQFAAAIACYCRRS
jgi:transposase-like protein